MAAFTSMTDGFTPNAHMGELIAACNERRLAAIASGASGLPGAISSAEPGMFQGDGFGKPLHLLMQEMLEALAPHFVNHGAGYSDTLTDGPIPAYTLASWRAAAGLSGSGFRRAASWADPSAAPSFGYGKIQTGDIAGYWIWEDIVKGLKALRWTAGGLSGQADPQVIAIGSDVVYGATLSAAVSAGNAAWQAADWADAESMGSTSWHGFMHIYNDGSSSGDYVYLLAERCKPTLSLSAAAPVAATVTFVGWVRRGWFLDAYYDFGQGEFDENEWLDHASVGLAKGGTGASAGYVTMPSGLSAPFSYLNTEPGGYGRGQSMYTILKWSFDYS